MPKPCRVALYSLVLAIASANSVRLRHPSNGQPGSRKPLQAFGKGLEQPRPGVEDSVDSSGVETANEVDVLAFGDSLTDGFGRRPYPEQLEEMLNTPGHGQVYRVVNAGIPGELTASMVGRLPQTIMDLKSAGRKPKYVLILGGTNDLLWGNMTSDIVLANLKSMRAAAIHEHSMPILFTIPQLDAEQYAEEYSSNSTPIKINARESHILAVNKALKTEAEHDASIFLADISKISPKHLVDGVHFSGEGYARVAEVAFNVMKPMLGIF